MNLLAKIDQEKGKLLIGAFLTQMCLGSIYAWSVFQTALVENYTWTKVNSQLPFTFAVFMNPLTMIIAGKWLDSERFSPVSIARFGGVLLGIGYILAGFIDVIPNEEMTFIWLIFTYGIIAGAGIGFSYVVPIAILTKWFPERKGQMIGIVVAAFGGGSFIFLQIEHLLVENLTGGNIGFVFSLLGFLFMITIYFSSKVLVNAIDCNDIEISTPDCVDPDERDITPGQMLRMPVFWLMWLSFVLPVSAGMAVIGNIKSIVVNHLTINATVELIAWIGASAGGVLALFNALGRVTWGTLSDRWGQTQTLAICFFLMGLALLLFPHQTNLVPLFLVLSLIGFTYGGNFAIFPSLSAATFGEKNVGTNFSLLFTAVSVAGILGPSICSFNTHTNAFMILGVFAFFSIGLILISQKHIKNSV